MVLAHGIVAQTIVLDLTQPGAAQTLCDRLGQQTVDILVNNAGTGTYGYFREIEPERLEKEITLNITALTTFTRLLLPAMVARGRGRILNVASIASFLPGPFMAVYYATKAYVLSLSVALREECARTGVTVTCLCPGPTDTNFAVAARLEESPLFTNAGPDQGVEEVAEIGVRGCLAGRNIVIPGLRNWLWVEAARFAPHWLVAKVVRRMQGPRI
jgi:short-subunit dehydrogenase